ncbi:MAG: flagellar basal body P-ring protein FlgI [Pirellulales bacterium]|nr:flagellar basal body P-ring protein FlgI [Pirellulales bacterium]
MKSHLRWLGCGMVILAGCSSWDVLNVRSQSPDDLEADRVQTRLVGDLAVPYNMFPIRVEAVGLVTGLPGTGSDPAPSPQRAALLDEMQTRAVPNPNTVMASPNTALVLVRGVLRPGIQKGDRFDIEVRIPSRSDTTSLRGGHLLLCRLKEMAVLNNQFHEGHLWGLASGPVMVDPSSDGEEDSILLGRGRILGGGVATRSRQLGLVLKPGQQNVFNSARVANALNRRFHTFQRGVKVGVANAETDKFVELKVHPRYKDNIGRYVQVLRATALQESAAERMQRMVVLKNRLLDSVTSAGTALELEAIGSAGVDTLLAGIESGDPEVRFHSAEALAYLDRREAAACLGEAARSEPAFRVFALTALSAMDDFAAYEQLRELLAVPSAETRYGAFRALWAMNPADSLVLGERLGEQFSYHVLATSGPPLVHLTRNRRPEIVLFGQHQGLQTPLAVEAGSQIMVTSCGSNQIAVSKYAVEEADQKRVVSTELDAVIRAIVELGGTYPDVVQALQEAKAAGALPSRLEVDALPTAGRSYDRVASREDRDAAKDTDPRVGSPLPDLFRQRTDSKESGKGQPGAKSTKPNRDSSEFSEDRHPLKGFFAKMTGRDPD